MGDTIRSHMGHDSVSPTAPDGGHGIVSPVLMRPVMSPNRRQSLRSESFQNRKIPPTAQAGREGGGLEGHQRTSGHGFPAEGREERVRRRAGFLAGESGVPENPSPGSPATRRERWAILRNSPAEELPISEHQGVGSREDRDTVKTSSIFLYPSYTFPNTREGLPAGVPPAGRRGGTRGGSRP